MKIDEAIKRLNDAKEEGIKSIVIAWWEASAFEKEDGVPFSDDDTWERLIESFEDQVDWSRSQEDIQFLIEQGE
jgi:hypothetical protein